MKTVSLTAAAAIAATIVSSIPADALTTQRGVRVNLISGNSFEAVGSSARTAYEYWCGAATFARRELGAGWNTEIYVLRGLGPSETTNRRSAVQFTLDPVAGGDSAAVSFSSRVQPGQSLSVTQAHNYCNTRPTSR